jgi:organic radical activating enzyme
MNKPILPFVEIMITQTCNLSCAGCTNYSDLLHQGYLTWDEGKEQIEPWLRRVDIPDFGILGGEPLMNPQIRDWIIGLRELMPDSQIRFTTNGLLLDRNFDIIDLLADIGNCVFKIAVHKQDENLEKVIKRVFDYFDWEPVIEYGVSRYRTKNNMRFHVRRPNYFYKTFQGPYTDMRPHDNIPADAFDVCCQQTCPLIYNGKIYKCSTSGLLKDTLTRFNDPNIEQWQPYLFDGLDSNCSELELDKFLSNFGKPHSMCQMCPTKQDSESILLHLDHVTRKKIK